LPGFAQALRTKTDSVVDIDDPNSSTIQKTVSMTEIADIGDIADIKLMAKAHTTRRRSRVCSNHVSEFVAQCCSFAQFQCNLVCLM